VTALKNAGRGHVAQVSCPRFYRGIVPGDHEKKSGGEKCIEKQIKDG